VKPRVDEPLSAPVPDVDTGILSWLLEENNPSVRYFTLTGLLGKPENDREVQEARRRIMTHGVVPQVLAKQKQGGYWGEAKNFYLSSKYTGTVWTFHLLAALGADGADPRIRKACEFVLRNSQDRESGGFAIRGNEAEGGDHNGIEPCLTGNMVWCLLRFGLADDPRIERGVDWIVRHQRFDDGAETAPTGWPYDGWEMCWGKHTCHSGAVKSLRALAALPPDRRTSKVRAKIDEGVEYLLKHHVFKRSHDLSQVAAPAWTQLGFPRFWDTDVLEVLDLLTSLGCRDPRMAEAVDLVVSKRGADGCWMLESTWNGRTLARIEQKNKPSKWITLYALLALQRIR
jgi:hypothetical protein